MADRSDLAPSAMANLLIFCGSTPEKQRTLLITMIQEIQRPVKCQKLNKFTSRNRKLSVKQAKDQSLACSGLRRPLRREFLFASLRSNVVGNRTVPSLAGSTWVFWEMVFVFRKRFPGFPICRGYDKISAGAVRALVFIHKV